MALRWRIACFLRADGAELAEAIRCETGQNGVAGTIRDFRRHVVETLAEQAGLKCGTRDVILSGGVGYRLHEWIVVRDAVVDDAQSSVVDQGHANVPPHDGEEPVMRRREWILTELRKGRRLRAPDIAAELCCSAKTVKRDLDALRTGKRIKFVGPAKTGYYQITE